MLLGVTVEQMGGWHTTLRMRLFCVVSVLTTANV